MKATILVVDDEPMILKVLTLLLKREGYQVVSASNGLQGCEQVREHAPDLLISDVSMPLMDGIELVRTVQREFPSLRCILMSGGVDYQDIRVAEKLRGLVLQATLRKPFLVEDILSAVDAALQGAKGQC